MKYLIMCLLTLGLSTPLFSSSINPSVKVEGEFVTLGDLFTGLPKKIAGTELLIAPQPGKSLVLNQKWLSSIAKKYGIDYVPRSRHEHIKVIGASDTIEGNEIHEFIKDSLVDILKTDTFTIRLDQPDTKIHIPPGAVVDLEITRLNVNNNQTRFQAYLRAKMEDQEESTLTVSGKIQHTTMVPVLTRVIHKGDVIQSNDIEWVAIATNVVKHSTVLDEEVLIGASPKKQQLNAYKALNKHEIAIPYLVHKNKAVTIIGTTPSIKIAAKGKALESGTKDDYVKVMNIASKRVIHATVIGPQKVRVDIGSISSHDNWETF